MRTKIDYADKPYNRCLSCSHRTGKRCDGPRTSAMMLPRWCEYMRAMKEANHLTNIEISEKAGVSLKTIERIMAINCDQDIMRDTCRRIEIAIIGEGNRYPCYLAFEESMAKPSDTSVDYKEIIADLRSQLERMKRNNDYLWEENNRKAKMIDMLMESRR